MSLRRGIVGGWREGTGWERRWGGEWEVAIRCGEEGSEREWKLVMVVHLWNE